MSPSAQETNFTVCKGLDQYITALLNTRGLTMDRIIPPLIRKVDECLFTQNGHEFGRFGPYILDHETEKELRRMDAEIRRITRLFTYNLPINMGAALLKQHCGGKVDREKALDFIGLGDGDE